jgi:tripartite-type tricarboxylate transporter receptor subunit TctC
MAQNYPTKPIRLIVPFVPGGGTDIVARSLAQKLTDVFGQSVVVDNRPGAGGTIGAETAVRAAPDGYTLIMVSMSYAANAALYKLPYDPVNDITPVTLATESGFMVTVHPSVPAKNIKELIALAQAKPGALNYGSTGTGGITHLATELFKFEAKVDFTHIPYKGTGAALTDLLGGQIQLLWGSLPSVTPPVKAGRLRGLAVTTAKRVDAIPEMPTVAESGVPNYVAPLWYGILGPKRLPKDIAVRWREEIVKAMKPAEIRERFAREGLTPVGSTGEEFRSAIKNEIARLTGVVKAANIKAGS